MPRNGTSFFLSCIATIVSIARTRHITGRGLYSLYSLYNLSYWLKRGSFNSIASIIFYSHGDEEKLKEYAFNSIASIIFYSLYGFIPQ